MGRVTGEKGCRVFAQPALPASLLDAVMKRSTRKKTAIRKIRTPELLPISLLTMAGIMKEDPAELRDDVTFEHYITDDALVRGPYREHAARAVAVDPGNIDGGLIVAYATPALPAGMAFAWLILTDGVR